MSEIEIKVGPGTFDVEAEQVRLATDADAVVLCVLGSPRGSGVSVQVPLGRLHQIPKILRRIADGVEDDLKRGEWGHKA